MSDIIFLEKKKPNIGPSAGVPIDDDAKRIFDTFQIGQKFEVVPWKDRNVGFHRKLFALLNLVVHNNSNWKAAYFLLKLIQMDIGSVDIGKDMNGIIVQFPKSIAFKSMSEPTFTKLFSDIVNYMLANLTILLPGMSRELFNVYVQSILDMAS